MRVLRPSGLTREEECERILEHYGPEHFEKISDALDGQFRTIHNRAELLLGICGILISANVIVSTGRLLREGDFAHQLAPRVFLAAAGALVMLAAGIVVGGVLRVRWITQQPGDDIRSWVMSNLAYRDAKTRSYRISTLLVLVAMASYEIAVALALTQA
jgi:hypothetical protein